MGNVESQEPESVRKAADESLFEAAASGARTATAPYSPRAVSHFPNGHPQMGQTSPFGEPGRMVRCKSGVIKITQVSCFDGGWICEFEVIPVEVAWAATKSSLERDYARAASEQAKAEESHRLSERRLHEAKSCTEEAKEALRVFLRDNPDPSLSPEALARELGSLRRQLDRIRSGNDSDYAPVERSRGGFTGCDYSDYD